MGIGHDAFLIYLSDLNIRRKIGGHARRQQFRGENRVVFPLLRREPNSAEARPATAQFTKNSPRIYQIGRCRESAENGHFSRMQRY
jgi:hypothetical protein